MTRYEELKSKQRAALIVVLTLGLAAVPITLNWNSNIGTVVKRIKLYNELIANVI